MSVVKRVQKLTNLIARTNGAKVGYNRTKLASVVRSLRSRRLSKGASIKGSLKNR